MTRDQWVCLCNVVLDQQCQEVLSLVLTAERESQMAAMRLAVKAGDLRRASTIDGRIEQLDEFLPLLKRAAQDRKPSRLD